jgi:hypothetical protein
LRDVPVGTDLARSERERAVLRLVFARAALGRPLVLAPDIPAERVAILRQAFLDTLADPQFLGETRRQSMTVSGITSDELEAVIADAYDAPPDVIADTATVLGRAAAR